MLILVELPHIAISFDMCLGGKISSRSFLTHQNKVVVISNPAC